jgi:hypothetical protein
MTCIRRFATADAMFLGPTHAAGTGIFEFAGQAQTQAQTYVVPTTGEYFISVADGRPLKRESAARPVSGSARRRPRAPGAFDASPFRRPAQDSGGERSKS